MRVVDSGVAIAAFASWHESHRPARAEVAGRPQIAAHSMVEVLSVLTRLPVPHRAPAALVGRFLASAFREDPLTLDAAALRSLVVDRLPAQGITGGAVYDALIAETARRAGATLVTLDARARSTYQRIGCEVDYLGR